jgi:hypothetical protein
MLGSPVKRHESGVKDYVQTAEGRAGSVNIDRKTLITWLGIRQQSEAEITAVHDKRREQL